MNHKNIETMEIIKLTENELEVLQAIGENSKFYNEENQFMLDELKLSKSSAVIRGTVSSLQTKGLIEMYGNGYYFDGEITKTGLLILDIKQSQKL